MNDINGAHKPTHVSFFFPFDPKSSSFLSQNLNLLKPTSITLERGARYRAYAVLRESKLQLKQKLYQQQDQDEEEEEEEEEEAVTSTPTPPRKRVTFQGGGGVSKIGGGVSMVARSVPDFSAALRKENRKPVSKFETTPPAKNSSTVKGSRLAGSKSVGGSGAKGTMGRKSYASLEELKGLGSCVSSAIHGAGKGGGGRTTRSQSQKTILGCRQY